MNSTTPVGAADMGKPTIDTPEFRVLVDALLNSYWSPEPGIASLIAHIEAKLPAAAPADLYGLLQEKTACIKAHQVVLAERDAEIASLRAAAAKEAPSDERQAAWDAGNIAGRAAIEIHSQQMASNRHYRERVFNQIVERDEKEGITRFARLAPPSLAAPEAFKWPNGCDQTIPQALRYLANHPRPSGGEERFNGAHLYQLADEMQGAVRKIATLAAASAAPVQREGQAEAVAWADESQSKLYWAKGHPIRQNTGKVALVYTAAPSERAQEGLTEDEMIRLRRLMRAVNVDESRWTDEQARDAMCTVFGMAAGTIESAKAVQEGQQDQAVDALTDERIDALIISHRLMHKAWPMQSQIAAFARAIEAEVQRRCRAQRTTIEESTLVVNGPIDANALEKLAKEHPDEYFLKGSGVLKLIGAIRELEARAIEESKVAAEDARDAAMLDHLEAWLKHSEKRGFKWNSYDFIVGQTIREQLAAAITASDDTTPAAPAEKG